ncbi:MAG: FtsX-like permease family protein, partial [Selenomonadaceae bacterium]|nr:FtsX-like permease family protein [Selenomonadaceae bacterium]
NRGEDQDDVIFIPFTTMQERMMGIDFVNMINVSVSSGYSTTEVGQEIAALLHARHKIPENQEDDFEIMDMRALMEQFTEILNQMSLFVTAVAAISLLVGGIGIMNIMMVSVTERTREIGIRKALGATYLNIMTQFLIESMVLSGIGGLIGVALGCAIATGAEKMMPTTLSAYISATPIVVSVIFSMAVGLFFGIYPARKAAKLDPIEALRYE